MNAEVSSANPDEELPTAEAVVAYLRAHPDFLDDHPELLTVLVPPSRRQGDQVVDMQRFLVERQRQELQRLEEAARELLEVGRNNFSAQTQVHSAVMSMLDASTFEHFIEIVTDQLAVTLDADVITLSFEGDENAVPRAVKAGIHVVPNGHVEDQLGQVDVRLIAEVDEGDPLTFGEAAGLVRSAAMVRLNVSAGAPIGLLAIGTRREGYFHPQGGTELLSFLARVVEHCLRRWLDLPRPPV